VIDALHLNARWHSTGFTAGRKKEEGGGISVDCITMESSTDTQFVPWPKGARSNGDRVDTVGKECQRQILLERSINSG
jgi:hypothetical protein